MNNRAPATMDRDVMEKFSLDLPQYREVLARLEHLGIVEAIATGAPNGHLRINAVVLDIVRQLDEPVEGTQPNRLEQTKRWFFKKWWFVAIVIMLLVFTAVATVISHLKTILEWFGLQP